MTDRWRFHAVRQDATQVTGTLTAIDRPGAVAQLLAEGLTPLRVALAPHEGPAGRRATAGELLPLFQSLDSLLSAGVPLDRALRASEGLLRGVMQRAIPLVRDGLRRGHGLTAAFEATALFPDGVLGPLRAGEQASRLAEAVHQVAERLEAEADMASRIRQALAYPLLLLAAGAVSVAVIGLVVLPRFAVLLHEHHQALPWATRVLLGVAAFCEAYGWLLMMAALGGVSALASAARSSAGRRRWDNLALGIPVLGGIRHAMASARALGALGSALSAGMPLLPALQAAGLAANDEAIAERLQRTVERVSAGEMLSRALAAERVLAPGPAQLVAVGDESGQLAQLSVRASRLAAAEADRRIRAAVLLVEPCLVITLGALVAFVSAALLQAVYTLRPV